MKMNDPAHACFSSIETPAVVVDRQVLERNIARAAEIAGDVGGFSGGSGGGWLGVDGLVGQSEATNHEEADAVFHNLFCG